ncbi:MAG: hypothetical protein ABL949_02040 [Fimbriimonadaceae bacterium]
MGLLTNFGGKMFDLWETELSETETETLLNKAANEIKRRKMETPAILMFEMHKPLGFVTANAAVAFSPFLVPFLGFDNVNNYSRLLADRNNIEKLLQKLETPGELPVPSEDSC